MRIAIAQIDPIVGAFQSNVGKIKEAYRRACHEQAQILVTPELSICGYPPHDLIERPEMFDHNAKALQELMQETQGKSCALVVGHIVPNSLPTGRAAQNQATVLNHGKTVFSQAKTLLPTYDVFDEARYFEPAQEVKLWNYQGLRIALSICEDLWAKDKNWGRQLYGKDPTDQYLHLGAQLVLAISASPYAWDKWKHREDLHAPIAQRLSAPIIYVNQTGATDEILFDGASFALDASGKTSQRLPFFKPAFAVVETSDLSQAMPLEEPPEEIEILYHALVTGIREYFKRTGFQTALLGLSGGIDSSVVAVLATHALGQENVLGIAMPSQISSQHSLEDAEDLARRLSIRFEVRPIKFLYSTTSKILAEGRGELASLALENLQSRLRGLILLTLSNHDRSLVLTTANKSELATGYGTLYGDMAGALAPLGDVFKTQIYALARWINREHGNLIPKRCLTKVPSAELRPGQTDEEVLGSYDVLDSLLKEYIELRTPVAELEKKYAHQVEKNWVRKTLRLIEINEFKRRQAAPVLKISQKAFGIGRRIPLAKTWEQ